MAGVARRARGLPLLARGHPWGVELAHWLGHGWASKMKGPRGQGLPSHRL